jgi:uncharacterized membrane protein YcaP (DUF421 family)
MSGGKSYAGPFLDAVVAADTGFGAPWGVVGATVAVAAAMYVTVLLATRVAGRRTIAQLSAFDAVITVAVGTMLGSTAISSQISFVEGVAATVTLFGLQVVVGAVRSHVPRSRRLLDFEPVTVVEDGRVDLPHGPFGSQLTIDELRSQLRQRGIADIQTVEHAVLEPIGGVSASGRADPSRGDRSTELVLDDHLARRRRGDLDGDLTDNYAHDVVVLSDRGVGSGRDAVRELAVRVRSYEPGRLSVEPVIVGPDIGLVRWRALERDGETAGIGGVETLVVSGGRIVAHTVHWCADDHTRPGV